MWYRYNRAYGIGVHANRKGMMYSWCGRLRTLRLAQHSQVSLPLLDYQSWFHWFLFHQPRVVTVVTLPQIIEVEVHQLGCKSGPWLLLLPPWMMSRIVAQHVNVVEVRRESWGREGNDDNQT